LNARGTAAGEATKQGTDASHATPAAAGDLPLPNSALAGLGLAVNTDGAAKALATSATARDSAASGSGKFLPLARAQSGSATMGWLTEWTNAHASTTSWKTANGSDPNASYTWWLSTHAVSDAMVTWHALTAGQMAIAQ
jgi:hypothetical protein